jgi:hypothetical protein
VVQLDDFGTVQFGAATAVEDGQTVSIAQAGGTAITMIDRTGRALATPSALGGDGASFSVQRAAVAPTTPAPSTPRRGRLATPGTQVAPWSCAPVGMARSRLESDLGSESPCTCAKASSRPRHSPAPTCGRRRHGACPPTATRPVGRLARFGRRRERQAHREGGAAADHAGHVDSPLVCPRDPVDDRQPESRPARIARSRRVGAIETLEEVRQVFGRDPDTRVRH